MHTSWGKTNYVNYKEILPSYFKMHMHTHRSGELGCTLFVSEQDLPFSKLNGMNPQSHVIA